MNGNALYRAFLERFIHDPRLVNALITGADIWPPENSTVLELQALANDRIADAESAEAHLAVSSIRRDELLAARDALAALSAAAPAGMVTRYPLPALPNSVINRSTSACMATRPATSTSPSSPEPIAS